MVSSRISVYFAAKPQGVEGRRPLVIVLVQQLDPNMLLTAYGCEVLLQCLEQSRFAISDFHKMTRV